MVMDYIDGPSLADILAYEGAMPLDRCLRIMTRIVDALDHAHANDVVHRDLKPSNIMMRDLEFPIIVDFGIAKLVAGNLGTKTTQTGEVFGSPAYMSPEANLRKNRRCAVRSVCARLRIVRMSDRMSTIPGPNAVEVMFRHLTEKPQTLADSSLGRKFPARLESLVARLLEKEPEKRFANMAEVKRELEQIQNPAPMTAPEEALAEPRMLPALGGTAGIAALATLLAMVTAVCATCFCLKAQENEARAKAQEAGLNRVVKAANRASFTENTGDSVSAAEAPDGGELDQAFASRAIGAWCESHSDPKYTDLSIINDPTLDQYVGLITDGGLNLLSKQHYLLRLNLSHCSALSGTGFHCSQRARLSIWR